MKTFSRVLIFAAAGAMLAACAKDDGITTASFESIKASVPVPVTFGTYMGETAETRAGYVGVMNDTQLKETLANKGGFGVFGYYTNGGDYNSSSWPNFMWNQGVFFNTTKWEYSPIKYWPNETTTDSNGATSTHTDKLTFFAYAPYVSPTSTTTSGEFTTDETYGITKLSGNTITGDPKVSYKVDFTGLNSVDLLWAVNGSAPADATSVVTGTTWNISSGMPYIDLVKPKLSASGSTPVNFTFKHALYRMALTVQATRDATAAVTSGGTEFWDTTDGAANKTKIVIDYVKITGLFPTAGVLNLNNTTAGASTPLWAGTGTSDAFLYSGTGNSEITINATNNNLTESLRVTATSGTPAAASSQPDGVKVNSATNLMNTQQTGEASATDKYLMFIPDSGNKAFSVEIKYYVITDDANLNGGKSVIENVITKNVT